MAYSAAQIRGLCDTIAKHIIDAAAALGSTSALQAGQATSLAQIAALADATLIYPLLAGFESAMGKETAWIANEASYNNILDNHFDACAVLDSATGGLAAFLAAQSVQVDPHFQDAFNRAASQGKAYPSTPLKPYLAFGNAASNMGQFNATGGAGGAFVAGTAVNVLYGNAPLQMFNAGGGNIGGSIVHVTVTYSKYDGSGNLLAGQTVTVDMPAGTTPGSSVSLGVSGIAVTNITVTNSTNADQIAVRSTLLRTVGY